MDETTLNSCAEAAKNSMEIEGFIITEEIHEAAISKARRLIESGEADLRFERGVRIGREIARQAA